MSSAKLKFGERLYQWALEEWRREISKDFILLREMERKKVDGIHETLEMLKTFEKDQQWIMARALVRGTLHYDSKTIEYTERDKQLFEQSLEMRQRIRNEEASLRYQVEESQQKLKRSKLKKYVFESLKPVLGEKNKGWSSPSEFVYITPIGQFQVMTWVDMGGRYHQLSYHHTIVGHNAIVDGRVTKAPLGGALSLLSWLGIGQTMWSGLSDEDVEPVAKLLAKIISHFMNAVPKLLEGLSPDDC